MHLHHYDSPLLKAASLALTLVSLSTTLCVAGTTDAKQKDIPVTPLADSLSLGDRLENLGRIYKNADDPVLQELWLLGRFHGQYHWTNGSAGDDEGYETRRFRLGAQAKLFNKLTLHAQMVSGSDIAPFYNGFTELWAQWSFSDALNLTVGQQKHRFTHDRNVSSRYINYLERSMLTNMFGLDYTPAVTLSGTIDKWAYYTGVFSNATGRNMGRAFTELDTGWSYIASVTRDLGTSLGTDTAHLNFGYLYSDAKGETTNLDRFEQGVSSALILTDGPADLVTELTLGVGGDRGTAYGINIQPGYFITDNIQVVARYQLAASADADGLRAQRRYEREAGLDRGDLYQAAYFGVNYYIAKHRIKLMTGIEYATMGGEHTWTASTMVRFFFGPHSRGPFPMAQLLNGRY